MRNSLLGVGPGWEMGFPAQGYRAEVVVGGQGGFQTDPTAGGPQLNQGTALKASGQLQKLSSRREVPQMRYPERGGESGDGEKVVAEHQPRCSHPCPHQ